MYLLVIIFGCMNIGYISFARSALDFTTIVPTEVKGSLVNIQNPYIMTTPASVTYSSSPTLQQIYLKIKTLNERHRCGTFAAIMSVFYDTIKTKDPDHLSTLLDSLHAEIQSLNEQGKFSMLGTNANFVIEAFMNIVASSDPLYFQSNTDYLKTMLQKRQTHIPYDLNIVINAIDNIYTDKDVANIAEFIEDIIYYPAKKSAMEVARNAIDRVIMTPLRRINGTPAESVLVQELEAATHRRIGNLTQYAVREEPIRPGIRKSYVEGRRWFIDKIITMILGYMTLPPMSRRTTIPDINSVYLKYKTLNRLQNKQKPYTVEPAKAKTVLTIIPTKTTTTKAPFRLWYSRNYANKIQMNNVNRKSFSSDDTNSNKLPEDKKNKYNCSNRLISIAIISDERKSDKNYISVEAGNSKSLTDNTKSSERRSFNIVLNTNLLNTNINTKSKKSKLHELRDYEFNKNDREKIKYSDNFNAYKSKNADNNKELSVVTHVTELFVNHTNKVKNIKPIYNRNFDMSNNDLTSEEINVYPNIRKAKYNRSIIKEIRKKLYGDDSVSDIEIKLKSNLYKAMGYKSDFGEAFKRSGMATVNSY